MAEPANPLKLDGDLLRVALDRLEARIGARFPDRQLHTLAAAIGVASSGIQAQVEQQQDRQRTARYAARALTTMLVAGTVVAIGLALADFASGPQGGDEWLALVNDVIADVVYVAVAAAFLWAVPQRLGRRALLASLHSLRSIAHVIDMRQLSKDPERLRTDYEPTERSPKPLTPPDQPLERRRADLHYYLSHCVELLGMVSKVAALCGEESSDPVVLEMVNEIEALTTDMSVKIFAKLQLLPLAA